MAEANLKEANRLALVAVLVANLSLFSIAITADELIIRNWAAAAEELSKAVPAGILLILAGVLNAQLSADEKARIVYLRWSYPLPGAYAFTRYGPADHRVDMRALEQSFGPLPTEPWEQNLKWYQMYSSIKDDANVVGVHKEFLFTRDYHCLSLFILIGLGAAGFYLTPSVNTAMSLLAIFLAQFLLTGRAARNHGRRFVCTVLALKSANGS